MNSSEAAFPVVEIAHMIGIVLLVGTAAMVDFRLLSWRPAHTPVWEIASDLAPWTTTGLALVLITRTASARDGSGSLLQRSRWLFDFAVHRKVRSRNSTSSLGVQRFAGLTSLILWSCVVLGGRAIGVLVVAR